MVSPFSCPRVLWFPLILRRLLCSSLVFSLLVAFKVFSLSLILSDVIIMCRGVFSSCVLCLESIEFPGLGDK